jgi:hypothetical protein
MIKRITKPLFASIIAAALLVGGYSCANDDYLTDREIQRMIDESLNGQWQIVNIEVRANDWEWDDDAAQWKAVADLPELKEHIYEDGAILGYVFIGTQGVDEVQKLLPYVDTYYGGDDEAGNPIYFTETISVDYQLGNPSTVGFFIKDSQLASDPNAPQNYNFRIVLIW